KSSERLLYPMRRAGPKGGGSFKRISWEEALEEISARLIEISDEFGAEAIWPYIGSGNMGLIQGIYGAGQRLWNAIGASRHVMNACTIAGGVCPGRALRGYPTAIGTAALRIAKFIKPLGPN